MDHITSSDIVSACSEDILNAKPYPYIRKRSGELQEFNTTKIVLAISRALFETKEAPPEAACAITEHLIRHLQEASKADPESIPSIEAIQDSVEMALMQLDYHTTAKAYILYRKERAEARRPDIFRKRLHLKPYEYPELYEYVNAVRHSYWIHTEFNFTSDIQDFKVNVSERERTAIKHTMLAIAQIEVAVKTFWGDIYKKMPKPEIGAVGFTFAESEVRHMDAYSHLLEILGLNHEFSSIKHIPALVDRVNYLEKALKNARSEDNREYTQSILLFSLFIEHVSLFSQFLIMMSFHKHKNLFRGIANAVEATSKEEQIHGLFGIDLIKVIQEEHPDWFDEEYEEQVVRLCREAFEAEKKVIDWILEAGELEFLPKNVILEFVKNRFNNSLRSIGMKKVFEVDEVFLRETDWFDDEVIATKHGDFFSKKSINYNKKSKSLTGEDLF